MRAPLGLLVLSATLAGVMAIVTAGCNKPQQVTGTPPPATTAGTDLDDSVVTARVKAALVADPDVKGFDFKVETRKGEVQLSGFVDNQTQIDRAIAVARGVENVKNVDNKVSVKGAATTVGNKVDDGIVTTKVKAALLADANVKSFDIAVVTRKGEVQLSGFVDNQGQIDRAIEVARGIEGVRTVGNELSIKK
jgi:hyperosmotically inducible protein